MAKSDSTQHQQEVRKVTDNLQEGIIMTDTTTHATADSNMDKTIEIDSLAELSLRFIALDFALDGLYEHTKACEVEPEQVEAIDLIFRDLWKEYRGLLA